MDPKETEKLTNEDLTQSEDENEVFENEQPPKPALRRGDNKGAKKARRKPDRIKSWYITGSSRAAAPNVPEPSAVPVRTLCDINTLASAADIPIQDLDSDTALPPNIQSICCSDDGERVYFLISDSSRLFRYSNNQLAAKLLILADQGGKTLHPRHLCVDENEHLVYVSGEIKTNQTTANVLAKFALPTEEQWLVNDKQSACKYLGRTKIFDNLEKFGSLCFQRLMPREIEKEDESEEQKENEDGEEKKENEEDSKENLPESGLWIASPQVSHDNAEKTQIFKLTTDFVRKRVTVSLGRHGVYYLPRQLSIDESGWVYVSVDRVESGPQGSTKLWSSRLLTFPSKPPADSTSSEPIRNWMRVNSWNFEGLTPGAATAVKPGECVLVIDRDRGCLHKVTWYARAIEGHGKADCFPVSLKPGSTSDTLPTNFDGICRFGPSSVLLHKGLELFQLQNNDLK